MEPRAPARDAGEMRARDQWREILRVRDRERRFQRARGEEQIQVDALVRETEERLYRLARRSRPGVLSQHSSPPRPGEIVVASPQSVVTYFADFKFLLAGGDAETDVLATL